MTGPLVSCIMPTFNRRRFVPSAIAQFLRQDWPEKELVVIDDGADCVRDLVPDDPRITYVRLDRRATIGRKRNIACERARGEIVAHWDDDDWHAPDRLRRQATALLASAADLCGITRLLFCNPEEGRAWEFVYLGNMPWIGGSSMMYRRASWARSPFPDCDIGEDTRFAASRTRQQMVVMPDATFHVGRVHAANVNPKITNGPSWRPLPLAKIREVLGADWDDFAGSSAAAAPRPSEPAGPLVSCIMPTANRRPFVALALEHFEAQDYAAAELVVVDTGADSVGDLCAGHPRVRHLPARRGMTIGGQRNVACGAARGEIIVHWDDDDWYAPHRLRTQIEPILSGRADVTGLESCYVWNLHDGAFWTIGDDLHKRMFVGDVHGGTLAYRRSLLKHGVRYDEVNLAEDAALLKRLQRGGARLERVKNDGAFVYVRHGRNAWRFETGTFLGGDGWSRVEPPAAMPLATRERYRAIVAGVTPVAIPSAAQPPKTQPAATVRRITDCLGGAEIDLPAAPMRVERCVALVASEGCADFLGGALGSLARFGGIADVRRVVFVEQGASRCEAVARAHDALVLPYRNVSARRPGSWLKAILYSMSRAVEAKQYLCLDVDLLVLSSLRPLFETHAALPRGQILVAPEATRQPTPNLRHALESLYRSTRAETDCLLRAFPGAATETNVINDGVFVADAVALEGLAETLQRSTILREWINARRDVWWRTKGALNVALAGARVIEPLDSAYNAQLHADGAVLRTVGGQPSAVWRGRAANVLHFNGNGRSAYATSRRAVLGAGG